MPNIEELQKMVEEKKQQELSLFKPKEQPTEVKEEDNKLVSALVDNETAIDIAKQQYANLKNQKQIAGKMGKVVNRKTNADIESANLLVDEQVVNNKVKKAKQRNELLRLKKERKFLKEEHKHKLDMQRAEHLKEKYGDLLLRTCRKKTKGEDGKWNYHKDENGKDIINIPGKIRFFFLRLFDGMISGLNQTADILGALNKNVIKGIFIFLVLIVLFVPPIREWLLSLIGFKFN